MCWQQNTTITREIWLGSPNDQTPDPSHNDYNGLALILACLHTDCTEPWTKIQLEWCIPGKYPLWGIDQGDGGNLRISDLGKGREQTW